MRAHYFQHVPFEGLGSIEPWLQAAGYQITATKFFEATYQLPQLAEVDLLIVMGGPMSVNDERDLPWLVAEKQFVRQAIEAGKKVLGICLGAQMIASAMGAKVYSNSQKEIGWFLIQGARHDDLAHFQFPAETTVFHWHGETFDLPAGAVRLASSPVCLNQAFQLGRSTIGLQFHLETTPQSAQAIVAHCRDELQPSSYVQTESTLLAADDQRYSAINQLMAEVLGYLHRS